MTLFQSCLEGNGREALSKASEMISNTRPSAMWAILMHAAAWHEQRTFDTPHSTILTYSVHRMIEELGYNPDLLAEEPESPSIKVPDELREPLQRALFERVALHLAVIDHWARNKGPRYKVTTQLGSLDSTMRDYAQSVREQFQIGALKAALQLGSTDDPIRLRRMTASLGAEDADNLGHAFIMPISLLFELPHFDFKLPYEATLWHLTEYLVRKVSKKQPDGFRVDTQMDRLAGPTILTRHKSLFASAVIEYGILGHNGIFAHRIAVAADTGYVHSDAVKWLLERLRKNVGRQPLTRAQISTESLIRERFGTDWDRLPSGIDLPDSGRVRLWLVKNASDYWDKMMDLNSHVFEEMIPDIAKGDWPIIRAAQYAMPTVNGAPGASHVTIFTHAVWSLADYGLIESPLAALQTHRMLRQYLRGR